MQSGVTCVRGAGQAGVAWAEPQRPHDTLGTSSDLKRDKLRLWKQEGDCPRSSLVER